MSVQPDGPFKGALVGAGNVSVNHLLAWQKIPQAKILAIADPDLVNAHDRGAEFGISDSRVYPSLEALLAHETELDFVDITAPPDSHLPLVETAAARGLHVLCQKPFAPSLKEARQMIAICEEAGVLLDINENWRWRPWYRQIRQILHSGKIGQPIYARIFGHNSSWLPDRIRPGNRFYTWPRVILYDFGLHYIDVLRFLFGQPQRVYARLAGLNKKLMGEDRAIVMLEYERLTAIVDLSWSSFSPWGHPNRTKNLVEDLRIEGERGTIELVPNPERGDLIRLTDVSGKGEKNLYDDNPFDLYIGSYVSAQSHFIRCLRDGKTPETVASDNINSLGVMLAAYQAAETGQVVDIARFMELEC